MSTPSEPAAGKSRDDMSTWAHLGILWFCATVILGVLAQLYFIGCAAVWLIVHVRIDP